MIIAILILVASVAFWYVLYGLECFMNGGTIGRNQFLMPFQCLVEEAKWIVPIWGWRQRQLYSEKRGCPELAKTLPGPFHFFLMHVAIPFAPVLSYVYW